MVGNVWIAAAASPHLPSFLPKSSISSLFFSSHTTEDGAACCNIETVGLHHKKGNKEKSMASSESYTWSFFGTSLMNSSLSKADFLNLTLPQNHDFIAIYGARLQFQSNLGRMLFRGALKRGLTMKHPLNHYFYYHGGNVTHYYSTFLHTTQECCVINYWDLIYDYWRSHTLS